MGRHDLGDLAGLLVELDELGGVAEGRVDHRVLEAVVDRVGPVDDIDTLVLDALLAAARHRVSAGIGDRPAPMTVPRLPVV